MSLKKNQTAFNDLPDPTRPFARFFRRWMAREGYTTPAEAAVALRISATTAYSWACGAACIPRTRLAIYAPLFGVPLGKLARAVLSGMASRNGKQRIPGKPRSLNQHLVTAGK